MWSSLNHHREEAIPTPQGPLKASLPSSTPSPAACRSQQDAELMPCLGTSSLVLLAPLCTVISGLTHWEEAVQREEWGIPQTAGRGSGGSSVTVVPAAQTFLFASSTPQPAGCLCGSRGSTAQCCWAQDLASPPGSEAAGGFSDWEQHRGGTALVGPWAPAGAAHLQHAPTRTVGPGQGMALLSSLGHFS